MVWQRRFVNARTACRGTRLNFLVKFTSTAGASYNVIALFVFNTKLSLADRALDVSELLAVTKLFLSKRKPVFNAVKNLSKCPVFKTSLVDIA